MAEGFRSDDSFDRKRLFAGEKVACPVCEEGFYEAFGGEPAKAHDFICNHCGSRIHFDPNVIVE